jgi:hypothetical protein
MSRTAEVERKPAAKKPAAKKPVRPKTRSEEQAELVKALLKKLEGKLSSKEFKGTLGDFIRLLQLQRELDDERPAEIKVTWVEPTPTPDEESRKS